MKRSDDLIQMFLVINFEGLQLPKEGGSLEMMTKNRFYEKSFSFNSV